MRRRRASNLVCFSDVQYSDLHGGVAQKVDVKGSELRDLFHAIALDHSWPVEELLSNSAVVAGSKLECRILVEQPTGWSLTNDPYIKVKLNQSHIVRGHTFLGNATAEADVDFHTSGRPTTGGTSTPARPKRKRSAVVDYDEASPQTKDAAGVTQPYAVRLHRAAALATCKSPGLHDDDLALHICGNKRCCVVSHFRFGSADDNEKDETHHQHSPGTSRLDHPQVQP